jgi:hypothetical protein
VNSVKGEGIAGIDGKSGIVESETCSYPETREGSNRTPVTGGKSVKACRVVEQAQ